MIVVSPFVADAIASIDELHPQLQAAAVRDICRTSVRMLANNVITLGVQSLISSSTGNVIFYQHDLSTDPKTDLCVSGSHLDGVLLFRDARTSTRAQIIGIDCCHRVRVGRVYHFGGRS